MSTTLHDRGRWMAWLLTVLVAAALLLLPNLSCTRPQSRYSDESFYEDVAWAS